MSVIRRLAIFGLDTDKHTVITVDQFLYRAQRRLQKRLRKERALAKKLPSPSDAGTIKYLEHCLSCLADLRYQNCSKITKPAEDDNERKQGSARPTS